MGAAVSGWPLARAVSSRGQLGVVPGTLDLLAAGQTAFLPAFEGLSLRDSSRFNWP